jgi:competence protein ComEC
VLVGVGADNTYGHPTQDALDLYESHGATILRTDLCSTSGVLVREGQTLVAGGCS